MRKRVWIAAALGLWGLAMIGNDGPSTSSRPSSENSRQEQTTQKPDLRPNLTAPQVERSALEPAKSQETEAGPTTKGPDVLRYVTGSRVALRSGPSTSEGLIDRLDSGRQVFLLREKGDWSKVRDKRTQREGWIASRFLADQQRRVEKEPDPPREPQAAPAIPDPVIVQRIIEESVASYPGSCACPFSTDRRGRRCGARSAYSKPGGYAPICYARDVSPAMIQAFRVQ
jgi:uncharacterized protein YraI